MGEAAPRNQSGATAPGMVGGDHGPPWYAPEMSRPGGRARGRLASNPDITEPPPDPLAAKVALSRAFVHFPDIDGSRLCCKKKTSTAFSRWSKLKML